MLKSILRPILLPILELLEPCISIFAYTKPKIHRQKSIVILRTDAIGDYLLFRAFLREVREAYPTYHITLIGNSVWKSLYEYFDASYCDDCMWIHTADFQTKRFYKTIAILRHIKQIRYELLINPQHSRDKLNATIASHINALSKIAPQGDDVNLSPRKKARHDRIYSTLTPSSPEILFEFYRNKEFFEQLLQKPLSTSPKLHLPSPTPPHYKQPYSILFVGASAKYRRWSVKHFAEVGEHLMRVYKHNVLICGGNADIESGFYLEQLLQAKVKDCKQSIYNLTGKTTLAELVSLVYNGNHLGRFIPYPKEIRDKYYPVFHPYITANYARYKELSNAFAYKSTLNINDIQPRQVIDVIDQNYTQRSDNE